MLVIYASLPMNIMRFALYLGHRRPFGVEPEYFVQLFLEMSESAKPGYIGSLLTKMYKEQSISFTQVIIMTCCITCFYSFIFLDICSGSI